LENFDGHESKQIRSTRYVCSNKQNKDAFSDAIKFTWRLSVKTSRGPIAFLRLFKRGAWKRKIVLLRLEIFHLLIISGQKLIEPESRMALPP
jgi:hypothetical protein